MCKGFDRVWHAEILQKNIPHKVKSASDLVIKGHLDLVSLKNLSKTNALKKKCTFFVNIKMCNNR